MTPYYSDDFVTLYHGRIRRSSFATPLTVLPPLRL